MRGGWAKHIHKGYLLEGLRVNDFQPNPNAGVGQGSDEPVPSNKGSKKEQSGKHNQKKRPSNGAKVINISSNQKPTFGQDSTVVSKPFGCTKCKKTFASYSSAQSHVRDAHRPPSVCRDCGTLFRVGQGHTCTSYLARVKSKRRMQ